MLTGIIVYGYADIKAKHLNASGHAAPSDMRLFLYPVNVGGAENKIGVSRIISRVLYHVFSPRHSDELSNLLNKGYKKMKEFISYTFKSTEIRTTIKDGKPWFVATDVAQALEYADATHALRYLDDDERDTLPIKEGRILNIINESGLYSLILRSRKPEAKAFKKFVTSEVLPSIRKTGGYGINHQPIDMKAIGGLVKRCCAVAVREELASTSVTTVVNVVPIPEDKAQEVLSKGIMTLPEMQKWADVLIMLYDGEIRKCKGKAPSGLLAMEKLLRFFSAGFNRTFSVSMDTCLACDTLAKQLPKHPDNFVKQNFQTLCYLHTHTLNSPCTAKAY